MQHIRTGYKRGESFEDEYFTPSGEIVNNDDLKKHLTAIIEEVLPDRLDDDALMQEIHENMDLLLPDRLSQLYLDGRYPLKTDLNPFVKKDELAYNVKDRGVIGNNVADDTASLNAAAAAIYAINPDATMYIPPGTYKITGPVQVKCRLSASEATFNYTGNGDALIIGDSAIYTQRRMFALPKIIKQGRTNLWDGASRGVVMYNLNECIVFSNFIQDFEIGMYLMGNDKGFAYNTIFMGTLWENHRQQVLDCTNLGWINENTFIGGRWQKSLSKGATVDDPNSYEVYGVAQNVEGGPNNNVWYRPCIEGPNVSQYRVYINGSHNEFHHARWETPSNAAFRVRWGANSVSNLLWKGYGLVNCVETFDNPTATISPSERYDAAGMYLNNTVNTTGQVIPNNADTTVTGWTAPVARGITYDSTTGEFTPRPGRWRIFATVSFAPNATGRRFAKIMTGATLLKLNEKAPNATVRNTQELTASRRFNGAETFKLVVNQTSGADLALDSSSGYVTISADYLGG
ncbi:pectin lyase fold domain-containing protein [Rhizobium phage RHph_N3_8]|uniref:pectin lyase fold domain-containing protein n=1 Tax=Rhizobium phage RHph_N3_8 TaxID=2509748 RepID=UPI001AF6E1CD|nr:pectin lyase fold domain-containing protein [Rhizobium phage RHph_N3_8]QIG76021.1 pectin lyase fold domain-containing protein [Rhizobium phage RHph_N3_8]